MVPRGRHPNCRLTDLMIRQAPPGRHSDGNGLYLYVQPNGRRSWVQRIVIRGKRRDLGLGAYPAVSLPYARQRAARNRRVARSGGDPTLAAPRARVPTMQAFFDSVIRDRSAAWRTTETARRWHRLFDTFARPVIGDRLVSDVTLDDLRKILAPLPGARGERGYVLRQHLEHVMNCAIAHKYRSDNPAVDVKVFLPRTTRQPVHYASLPHPQVAEAMRAVRALDVDEVVSLLLLFIVLTACRYGEAAGLLWEEIDFGSRVWFVPAERMKSNRLHRVPLARQVIEILDRLRELGRSDSLAFALPARTRPFRPVPNHALHKLLHRLGLVDQRSRKVTVHGFRATYRGWTMEVDHSPDAVSEAALAHLPGDQTVRAYARSDVLDARREQMQRWADYVIPPHGSR